MKHTIRTADGKGRVTLPGFAHATVIVEAINESEYRVRKAQVIPDDELTFSEEKIPLKLSQRDARAFLMAFEQPPAPNKAARRAAKRFKKHYG